MDVQGVSLSTAISMDLQGVFLSTNTVWMWRVCPFPPQYGRAVQGVSFSSISMVVQGVSLSTANRIDVQIVIISTARSMDMQCAVCTPLHCQHRRRT